ncbi:MAG: PAS domain S-box protein, partial [Chloroflexota bacterium]
MMMKPRFRNPNWNKPDRGGLLIAGLYLLLGGLWILFSDRLAALLTANHEVYMLLSTLKGWGYVLVTGVLLYFLIQRNNRALRRANRDYLLLAENITDVIWVLDLDTMRFLYVSPSVERLRGLTSEEALRETLQEAVTPASFDYLERMMPDRLEEFRQGRIKSYTDELEQVRKDGSTVWVEVTSRFALDPETGHTELYAASRDVTERWQAQEILRKNEEKFFVLFEKAGFAASLSKLPGGIIVEVNQAFEKAFGYTRQEAVGKTSLELGINPDDDSRARILALLKEHGSAHNLELALRTKSGESRNFSVNIDMVEISGQQYILNTTQDITERVLAEEKVRQMKRLYATLSQVNQTIVRAKDRAELFQSICDLAVRYGEFALAWIALLDETTGDVRPAAASGLDAADWPFPTINVRTGPFVNGPIASALRASRVVTSEDLQADERTQNNRILFQEHGYHSSAAVPFRLGGKTIGVLSLVSREAGLFKAEEELLLLNEMGLDISFALETMEIERVRRQWADAFEHCALGMALGDPAANRIQTCNPVLARSLGRTISEVAGMKILEIYPPEDHDYILQSVAESDRAGRAQFETRMVRKDGSTFPVQMDVVSVRDESGTLLYRVATQQDITERKRAERALRDSQERLAGILTSTMDAVVSVDGDQRIILFNPAAELMFGYRAAQVIGQPLDRLMPERFRERHREHIRIYGETNLTRRAMGSLGPLTCLRANGEEFPAEIAISQVEMEGRKIYTAVLRDVTERLRAEAALQKSETRYRGLFDDSPVAIWEEDFSQARAYLDGLKRQGVRDFRAYFAAHPEEVIRCAGMIRVLDVNKAAVRMFKAASKKALIEATNREMSQGELDHNHEDLIAIANGRTSNSWDGSDETLDGERLEISLGWSVVPGYERDYSKVIVTTVDITERKRAEEDLRLSELRYRTVVENQTEFIVRWKPDGRRTFANDAYRRYFGITEEEAVSLDFMPLIVEEDRPAVKKKISRLLSGASASEIDVHRVVKPDGSIG